MVGDLHEKVKTSVPVDHLGMRPFSLCIVWPLRPLHKFLLDLDGSSLLANNGVFAKTYIMIYSKRHRRNYNTQRIG